MRKKGTQCSSNKANMSCRPVVLPLWPVWKPILLKARSKPWAFKSALTWWKSIGGVPVKGVGGGRGGGRGAADAVVMKGNSWRCPLPGGVISGSQEGMAVAVGVMVGVAVTVTVGVIVGVVVGVTVWVMVSVMVGMMVTETGGVRVGVMVGVTVVVGV